MRRVLLIALLVGSAATAGVGVALATAPSGVSTTRLGRISLGAYHLSSPSFKIFSRQATDTVVLLQTIGPGGSTGWHSHPGPAYIVVTQRADMTTRTAPLRPSTKRAQIRRCSPRNPGLPGA